MIIDPYTSEARLCDDAGMVSDERVTPGAPGTTFDPGLTYLRLMNNLRARTGLAPYEGPPIGCTGSVHLAGEHMRCTNPIHYTTVLVGELTEATEAGVRAVWGFAFAGQPWTEANSTEIWWCRRIATTAIEAAAPIIERQVREKVAREIKDFAKEAAKTDSPDAVLGLITASHIATGQKASSFDQLADELDAAIARGDAAGNETTGGDK